MNEPASKSAEAGDNARTTLWQREPDVLSRRCGESILVSIPGCDDIRKIEGAAVAVWSALDLPSSESDLVAMFAANDDFAAVALAANVHRACTELAHIGAIAEIR
jgi:hypothetical protein